MTLIWWQPFLRELTLWYLLVMAMGWIAFPLVFRVQRYVPQATLAMSRIVGLALWALSAAWLGWAGFAALFGLGQTANFYFALLVPALFSILALKQNRIEIVNYFRENWRSVLWTELAFFVAFFSYITLRSWCADATWDVGFYAAEKWGNMAMLHSLAGEATIPPVDPWLAGYSLNYYYFSHWVWAGLSRLSATAPAVAFNLGLATIFSLLVVQAYGLGRAISGRRSGGFWALVLVAFAGSPATWQQLKNVYLTLDIDGFWAGMRTFSLWSPSDVIPSTRNEFPAFNWALGDLHAHSFGLLLLMAALSIVLHLFRRRESEGGGWYQLLVPERMSWFVLGALMAAMWATNGWDLVVLGLVVVVWVGLDAFRGVRVIERVNDALSGWLLWAAPATLAILVFAMFYSSQTTMPLQIRHPRLTALPGALAAFASVGYVPPLERTSPSQWWAFWGFFAGGGLACGLYYANGYLNRLLSLARNLEAGRFVIAFIGVGCLMVFWTWYGWDRPGALTEPLGLSIVLMAVLVAYGAAGGGVDHRLQSSLVFIVVALLLQLLAEFIYIDDPIGPQPGRPYEPIQRYNTVFKLYYGAWMLFAVGLAGVLSGLPIFRVETVVEDTGVEKSPERVDEEGLLPLDATPFDAEPVEHKNIFPTLLLAPLAVAFILAVGAYSLMAVGERVAMGRQRVDGLIEQNIPSRDIVKMTRTLDALAFMEMPRYVPGDYRLGRWMDAKLGDTGGAIVEASSESYTMAGRFTVLSGLPNLLSWEGHEIQWRNSGYYNTIWDERQKWISTVYTSGDAEAVRNALESLAASAAKEGEAAPDLYVTWGSMERRRYGQPTETLESVTERLHAEDASIVYRYRVEPLSEFSGQRAPTEPTFNP